MKKRTTRKVNIAPGLQTVLMILLALELCAAVLLSTRLLSSGERTNRISLTEGGANTVVTVHGGGNSAPRGARLRRRLRCQLVFALLLAALAACAV